MKHLTILVCTLLLATAAWAAEPAEQSQGLTYSLAADGETLLVTACGSGTGQSDLPKEEIPGWAEAAGLEAVGPGRAALANPCPVVTSCGGSGCGTGICHTIDTGNACCTTSGGLGLCCFNGTIHVVRCGCITACTPSGCASCASSRIKNWFCA